MLRDLKADLKSVISDLRAEISDLKSKISDLKSGTLDALAGRTKIDDAGALVFFVTPSRRFLAELTNFFATAQARQVGAAKDEVASSVFPAGLINE